MGRILAHKNSGVTSPRINGDNLVEIASLLLEAEMEMKWGADSETQREVLFNAIHCSSCPFAFVEYILGEMPEQAEARDENGDLPIHVASSIREQDMQVYKCDECGKAQMSELAYYFNYTSVTLRHVLCEKCIMENEKWDYTSIPSSQKGDNTTMALLALNENHAQALNANEELPLIIALKAGQSWYKGGIQQLIDAYPTALSVKDKETDLFPFQLAAVKRDDKDGVDKKKQSLEVLNTVYEMMLKWPMANRPAKR